MRTFLLAIGLLGLAACGSGGGSDAYGADASSGDAASGLSPNACTAVGDCGSLQCLCANGRTALTPRSCAMGRCVDYASTCTTLCEPHGGLVSSRPQPTVIGSAECAAYLAKIQSLGCQKNAADPHDWCGESIDECDASKRAQLQCEVDRGTWTCDKDGVGWSMTSSCGRFIDRCP